MPLRINFEAAILAGVDWTLGHRAEHGLERGLEISKAVLSRRAVTV